MSLAYKDLPKCLRCGRLAETCVFYDAKGCVGVPNMREPKQDSPEVRDYWAALGRYHDRALAR